MIPSINEKRIRELSNSFSETGPESSRTTNFKSTGISQGKDDTQYKARSIDIWALGITIVIGGQYLNWNSGLSAGFGSYATGIFLIGTAYICLCFCTSELSSALPFAGGGYGLARVTLGFYFGFMVGCCEIIEYIIYTADTCLSISNIIIKSTGIDRKLSPLIWLIFYVSAVIIYCIGGKLFWRVSNLFAFLSLAILLIYFAGSFQFLDFQNTKYVTYSPVWPDPTGLIPPPPPPSNNTFFGNIAAVDNIGSTPGNPWFLGGPPEFMRVLPLAGWFYVGIESLNFAANDVNEPRRVIPFSVMSCIAVLFATSVLVLFVSCSLPPGDSPLAITRFPLSRGFELMFGMTGSKADLLSIPATYATAFGFIFSYGRLMLAMSESRLLPRILRVKWGNAASASTSASTIVGSIIGYMVCIFVYFFPAVEKHLFNICILSAFGAYLSQFVGFINLRTRLADLPRLYHSPLGLCGAYYGIAVFSLATISVIVFQKDGHMAFITVFSIAVLTSAHYFCTAKHHQKFSKDELKTLFNAHVFKLGIASNKSRLDMAKKSAKRFYKRSYDSDRNSYSGGEQGGYRRNSSESLNAAMRSIVQRNEKRILYACERDRVEEEEGDDGGEGEDGEDDNDSDIQDHNFPSVSGGSVKACYDDVARIGMGIGIENLVGVNDKMATSSIKRIAAKSLTSIINARNRKMDSKVMPYKSGNSDAHEAKL